LVTKDFEGLTGLQTGKNSGDGRGSLPVGIRSVAKQANLAIYFLSE
jgi:hypothetical protein